MLPFFLPPFFCAEASISSSILSPQKAPPPAGPSLLDSIKAKNIKVHRQSSLDADPMLALREEVRSFAYAVPATEIMAFVAALIALSSSSSSSSSSSFVHVALLQ
jgi:hypothetical protein